MDGGEVEWYAYGPNQIAETNTTDTELNTQIATAILRREGPTYDFSGASSRYVRPKSIYCLVCNILS